MGRLHRHSILVKEVLNRIVLMDRPDNISFNEDVPHSLNCVLRGLPFGSFEVVPLL